jgi:hypothetical protein
MTTFRGREPALTLDGVGEQQPEPVKPEPRRRTPHGDAVIFGVTAVAWLALIAVLGHALALPRLWWAVVTVAVALLAAAVARLATGPTAVAAWWAVAFPLAGAWLAWSRFAGLRTPAPWLWLAAGSVLLIVAWPLLAHLGARRAAELKRRQENLERAKEENRWPVLLERIGHKGIRVTAREDTRNGYALTLKLPASGKVTWKGLAKDRERLEVAAGVRHGSLRFEPGELAHDVLLFVSTVDVLAETVPYVDDGKPMSIRNPIPVGLYEDGSVCSLTLREVCVLIAGVRGSGKSNLLNVLIAQLVRCVDVLIFVIDPKHRLVMPWVQPFLADPAAGEAIDWPASGREGTEAMLEALAEAIRQRSASGSGGEKIEPTPLEPAVITIVDEVASVFNPMQGPRSGQGAATNSKLAGIALDVIQKGRSEAIDLILAGQRATVDMVGGGDLKSQISVRIGLRTMTQADASYVIPDDQHAAQMLAALKYAGTGLLMEDSSGRVAPVKFFRIEPQQIPEIARRYGPLKPAPDPVLERALGDAYDCRWDSYRAARKQAALSPATADVGREFERITAGLRDMEDADPANAGRRRMRDFIARAGQRGVTVSMITNLLEAEHMGVSERTVRRWLADDADAGILERHGHLLWRSKEAQ